MAVLNVTPHVKRSYLPADQEFVEKNSDSCSTTSESSDSGLEGSVSGFEMEETVGEF